MKITPYLIASGAVLGTAAILVASGSGASTIQGQLITNQRISQAAVLRSNQALNYMAPVRTAATDAANTGKQGVTPLSRVTGAGQGWTTAQIADGAITNAKLADPVYTAVVSAAGAVSRGSTGVTASQTTNPGVYKVTFPVNVSQCTYQATVGNAATGAITGGFASVSPDTATSSVDVETFGFTGVGGPPATSSLIAPANLPFHLTVTC